MSDKVGGGDAPDDRKTVFGKPPGSTDDRETRYIKDPEIRSGPGLDDRETHYDPPQPETSQSRQPAGDAATDSKRTQARAQALGPGARILNDQYELLEQVRGGAQARAFKARRIVDDHVVFVKIQENSTREHDVFAKQLSLRDRILAIRHRNLLRCYDIGLQGEALCEVYEFVDGQTLADWLDAWRENGRPIPEENVRALVAQLADGINVLHETTGLMHRDIKPENIMVLGDGRNPIFQIVDYGAISRLDTNSVTEVIVTRRYGPPEGYERYTINSNISRSWDWWSLGRLVQEAVDGVHAQDQIARAFPKQVAQYASKESEQRAVQAIFDTIMSEREFSTYQMHAGMVELTAKNPRARPWIPLLRGLLTYSRRGRWGYPQVHRFLQGQEVAETYNARREVDHFELDGEFWVLPQLAVRLAADAAQTTAEGAARWEKAKSLVYRGEIARYITSVLEDEDLRGRLKTCITRGEGSGPTELGNIPRDRELGTALALFTLAEGQLEVPSVRDKILDAQYLVALAQRLEGDADDTGQIRLRELLSAEFQSAVRAVTPPGNERKMSQILEGVERIRRDIDELQRRLRKYDVEYARSAFEKSPEKAVVWVAASKEDDVLTIETEYRPKLFRTGNARLQEIYGAGALADQDPLDIKALRIALLNFSHNGFETYELQAQALQQDAQRWRAAAAMRSAAVLLWKPRVLWTLLWAAPLTAAVILYNSGIEPSRPDAQLQTFNWLYVGLAAVAVPLLLVGLAKLLWHTARHDLSRLGVAIGDKRVVTRKSLRQSAAQLIGQERAPLLADYGKRLRAINTKIRALSGVDHAKYVVPEPRLPLSWTVCALFGLGALVLAFGGALYGGVFHEGGTNSFRNNAARAAELSPAVDAARLLSSITPDDIPIRTTRVVIFNRGRNTECIVPEGETVYLKKAFGAPKPGGVATAVVVLPKSLCPNQAEMHERQEIARDALQSSVLNSPETAHKLALLDQKLDDHMRTRWPQYYVPPDKRRPHNQQPANVMRSANDCVVWANDGQELRFTGRIEREANGVTVAHMEGLDAHGDCTLTFADAWLLRERMDFWASHAKDANYARQFQRTQSEVTRAAGALKTGAPRPGPRGGANPATAQVEHQSAATPAATASPPPAQSPPETVSGNIDSFTPEGWPVVDGQTIRLAGIGDLAPAQLPRYENWMRSNGNNLDCSWTDRGAGYTCFTHNQARVNVGFMLLLNGTATASATAIPPYRKAMMNAMQARQGRWAQTGTARGQ